MINFLNNSLMKNLTLIVLFCSTFLFTSISGSSIKKTEDNHCATCRGSRNCRACTSCNYCAHCNSGGSCGVCSRSSSSAVKTLFSKPTKNNRPAVSYQCKGITKKGLRCKRMVKTGEYCWQHS